jgi:uncharacterized phage protein (TIGR01671 family)
MKRKIKFRAWDVDNKEFAEEFEITHDGYVRLNYMDGDYFDNFKPKSNLIAMQYTGLKDKNGVEIYEGDMLDFNGRDLEDNDEGKVIFSNGKFEVVGFYDSFQDNAYDAFSEHAELEVIGNIYQDKESIK